MTVAIAVGGGEDGGVGVLVAGVVCGCNRDSTEVESSSEEVDLRSADTFWPLRPLVGDVELVTWSMLLLLPPSVDFLGLMELDAGVLVVCLEAEDCVGILEFATGLPAVLVLLRVSTLLAAVGFALEDGGGGQDCSIR